MLQTLRQVPYLGPTYTTSRVIASNAFSAKRKSSAPRTEIHRVVRPPLQRRRATRSPLILIRDHVDPGRRQVVVGAGGRAAGQVDGEERRPVVGDHHDVVLRHVDGRGELEVTWEERKRADQLQNPTAVEK